LRSSFFLFLIRLLGYYSIVFFGIFFGFNSSQQAFDLIGFDALAMN